MNPRPLDRAEAEAFRVARLLAVETMPYFARALFSLTPLAAPDLGTYAVDRWWRLYLDPNRMIGPDKWSTDEQAAVLLHEIGHVLRDHAGRADQLDQPHSAFAWNLAGDAEINDDLISAGVPLPDGVITPAALGCQPGGLAEDYYKTLGSLSAPPANLGCGSGAGSGSIPGERPGPDPAVADATPGLDEPSAELVRRVVARDVLDAAKARGDVPANLTRWASDTLAPPTVAWTRVLRAAVRRAVAFHAGRTDYTYSRPSRRRIPGVVLPSMRGQKVRVSVVIDTSGSMSTDDLSAVMSELRAVLSSPAVDRGNLRVVVCDAAATMPKIIRGLADVDLTGGGGTDMRVGIDAALATGPRPHIVIVLTDGYTPWPDAPSPDTTLICAITANGASDHTPEWAVTVQLS